MSFEGQARSVFLSETAAHVAPGEGDQELVQQEKGGGGGEGGRRGVVDSGLASGSRGRR